MKNGLIYLFVFLATPYCVASEQLIQSYVVLKSPVTLEGAFYKCPFVLCSFLTRNDYAIACHLANEHRVCRSKKELKKHWCHVCDRSFSNLKSHDATHTNNVGAILIQLKASPK